MLDCIFFLGAGASVPFDVPKMTDLATRFEERTRQPDYGLGYVVQEIKNRLKDYKSFDIEALLTVLQDIVNYGTVSEALFNHPSLHFFTPTDYRTFASSVEILGRQYHNEAKQILGDVRNFVVESCDLKHTRDMPFEIFTELFSSGLVRYDFDYRQTLSLGRTLTIENAIFTTNYDLVLEAYCSHFGLRYEVGEKADRTLNLRKDNTELYGGASTAHRIYKLHGSINWYSDQHGVMRWSSEPVKTGQTTSLGHKVAEEVLVYPAFAKYTFREPFYSMFHHLKDCLVKGRVCCVVGYSFRDEDLLGLFLDAMAMNEGLYLILIDPLAEAIALEKFPHHKDRVHCISEAFSVEAAGRINEIPK